MTVIDKLSALTGPDRETEEAIYAALGNCNHKRYECYRVQGDSGQTCLDCGKDLYGADRAPRYTSSIDAAMTLARSDAEAFAILADALVSLEDDGWPKGEWAKQLPRHICLAYFKGLES